MKKFLLTTLLAALTLTAFAQNTKTTYEKVGGTLRLVRNGKPIVMLAGELHNSSASTAVAIESSYRCAKQMGMNTVIPAVTWEQFEPEPGKYDYSVVDNIIAMSKKYDLLSCITWFGSWKNGESSYTPHWVKVDTEKYFHTVGANGLKTTALSPLCKEAMKADAKAYAALMKYIREHDTERYICVMQVENEVGSFIEIDRCKAARKAIEEKVPSQLISYLKSHKDGLTEMMTKAWTDNGCKTSGTWKQLFGDTDQMKQFFMAWNFASYCEYVAKAGKKEYDIPMYVNCWLAGDNGKFGSYPNGGPRPCVIDVYKAAAPSIDWLSPDEYNPNYYKWLSFYKRPDNALFIPEINREAGPAYYALCELDAMCYSPFGYEECFNDKYLLHEYKTLNELLPLISDNQGKGKMHGFVRMKDVNQPDDSLSFKLGDYNFNVHYIKGEKAAHGMAVQLAKDEFIVAGVGAYITFSSDDASRSCKMSYAEEIEFDSDGKANTLFVINGDETGHHNMLYLRGRLPKPDYDEFGIHVDAPMYAPSYQRMHWKDFQEMFKVSGIYRIKLYSYTSAE